MKKFLVISLCVLAFVCCKQGDKTDADLAGQVAKEYYEYLLHGRYAEFVDGTWRPDTIESGYHEELVNNAKMYVGDLKEKHQGLKSVEMKSVENAPDGNKAIVFLVLHFGDDTQEQVAVPMLRQNNTWYME